MYITFLIGNGFDLRLGLKTKFTDMYSDYVNVVTNDAVLKAFKVALQSDGPKYKTWADFEMGMAKYAERFENEDDFIKCIRDFKSFMIDYLRQEENKFSNQYNENSIINESDILSEIRSSLVDFYLEESPNVIARMSEQLANFGSSWQCNFITFNYTNTLELLLKRIKLFSEIATDNLQINSIVHIHGNLDKDVVLGVDNEAQLANLKFQIGRRVQRAFIKPKFNDFYDVIRVRQAKRLISNSRVICIYGLSLGESDLTWSNEIVRWLKSNQGHELFYFVYGTPKFETWNQDGKMDTEEDLKYSFLSRICNSEKDVETVFDQVHIPVGKDIFGVCNIFEKNKTTKELIDSNV